MKINWGTAIVLVFIGFISFILYFVVRMNTEQKFTHDLVTEEYYKQELAFQKEINAEKNAKTLKSTIQIKKTDKGLLILFPKDRSSDDISGTVSFYRPSNKKLDFEIPISLSDAQMIVPHDHIIEGRWNITIDWKSNHTPYLFKKSFMY